MEKAREWVPVEVLWDEDLRRNRREVERFVTEDDDELFDWSRLVEEAYSETPQVSKRRRKRMRGERE